MFFLKQEIFGFDYLSFILLLLLLWTLLVENLNLLNKSKSIKEYLLNLTFLYKKKVTLLPLIPFIFIVHKLYGQILLSIYTGVLLFFIFKRKELRLINDSFRTYFSLSIIVLIYILLGTVILMNSSLNILALLIIYILIVPLFVLMIHGFNSFIIKK